MHMYVHIHDMHMHINIYVSAGAERGDMFAVEIPQLLYIEIIFHNENHIYSKTADKIIYSHVTYEVIRLKYETIRYNFGI